MTRKQQDKPEELYLTLLFKGIKSVMYLKAYGLILCVKVMICIFEEKHGCDDQHWRNRAVHFFATRSCHSGAFLQFYWQYFISIQSPELSLQ